MFLVPSLSQSRIASSGCIFGLVGKVFCTHALRFSAASGLNNSGTCVRPGSPLLFFLVFICARGNDFVRVSLRVGSTQMACMNLKKADIPPPWSRPGRFLRARGVRHSWLRCWGQKRCHQLLTSCLFNTSTKRRKNRLTLLKITRQNRQELRRTIIVFVLTMPSTMRIFSMHSLTSVIFMPAITATISYSPLTS